jgi:hypothetical protein
MTDYADFCNGMDAAEIKRWADSCRKHATAAGIGFDTRWTDKDTVTRLMPLLDSDFEKRNADARAQQRRHEIDLALYRERKTK